MSQVFRANIKSVGRSVSAFGTNNYDRIHAVVTMITSIGGCVTYGLMHTYLKDKYKAVVQMYKDGEPDVLSPPLQQLADEVFEESHIAMKYKILKFAKFFPVIGTEPFGIGSFESHGVLIGIPFNFTYNRVEDIKTIDISSFGEHNPHTKWRSDAGQQFLQSLVLSENAKRFAIARELHLCNTLRVHINTFGIIFGTIFASYSGQKFIEKYGLHNKSFMLKSAIRLSGVGIGFLLWCAFYDFMNWHWQIEADAAAVKQGADYYEGGVEFYKKLRQRNKASRVLFEERGEKYFSSDGEYIGTFRRKNVPIKTRLTKINEAISEMKNNVEEDSNAKS